jgi:hypothetical protein
MINNLLNKIVLTATITYLGTLTLNVVPSLAQTKQSEPIIVSQNNPEIPKSMDMNQNKMGNMKEMMTNMQEMMTNMQEMMTNMTPEQKKAHEQMMTGDLHTMMMEMDKMHQMMMGDHNSMNPNGMPMNPNQKGTPVTPNQNDSQNKVDHNIHN